MANFFSLFITLVVKDINHNKIFKGQYTHIPLKKREHIIKRGSYKTKKTRMAIVKYKDNR